MASRVVRSCQPAHVQLLRPEEREHGPVPQVDAVADLADEDQRRPSERAVEPAGRRCRAAGQDERGADGEEREAAVVEPLAGAADEPHDDDAHERDRRQQVEPVPDRGSPRGGCGSRGRWRPRSRRGSRPPSVSVPRSARAPSVPGLKNSHCATIERGDGDHRQGEERPGRSLGDLPDDEGDDGPDHVELLLDGQAPCVVERRRRRRPASRSPGRRAATSWRCRWRWPPRR